ncbi:MAG: Rieske 2Fe-2S domain-containing protein [Rhodospirillales bacterium]|jgi:phenylpropionate dioxygenase-like ring-hydroxylating dioxygenase large terminal subunit
MTWTDSDIAALVEPDRAHRKAYVDPELFELEMERIFESCWVYIGHESQVKKPGDYYLARVGRQPMMMTRDHNGEIYVLYNRCPHRGSQLCSARSGNAGKRIRCSYHAWMFNLDGSLDSIPAVDGYDGTGRSVSSPEFQVRKAPRADNYRGFWFASLAEDGPDLESYLGYSKAAFDQLIDRAPGGETEVVGECFQMIQQSNWKIFLENQLDASHPGATHESSGVAAMMVERDMREAGEEPPLSYGFISDFARIGIEGWGKFGTAAHPNGHCTLEGYMGLRPDDPDTNEYVKCMYDSYGEDRAEEILGVNLHHVLVYPCLSVQPPLQQLRAVRPLAPNRTLTEIWHFRLKDAPEAIYQRALGYYYLVNSPSTMINADDLFNWWKVQHGLESDGGDWVNFHRNAGFDVIEDNVRRSPPGSMSEMPMRHMMHVWKDHMTANGGGS